jgi:hypothetical protein
VLDYPLRDIGTELDDEFLSLVNHLWFEACIAALNKDDPSAKACRDLEKHGTTTR